MKSWWKPHWRFEGVVYIAGLRTYMWKYGDNFAFVEEAYYENLPLVSQTKPW